MPTALRPPLHMHDTGEGPALLLLHAFPQDASMWDHQVAAWSDRYRCLRPDVWGCGGSPAGPAGATLDSYAAALLEALDALSIDRYTVVGLSMGGYMAFALARLAPQRQQAAVLVSTHARADSDSARTDRLEMARTVRRDGAESFLEPMVERLLSPRSWMQPHILDPCIGRARRFSAEGFALCQEMMAARPASPDVAAAMHVPVLVVSGSDDALVTPAIAGELTASIPGARAEVFEQCGHLVNVEQPHRFNAVVGEFIDQLHASV